MIKRKDDVWTTIQCQGCMDCHKVLNDRHMSALLCPYCGTTIMLGEGSTPRVDNLETLNAAVSEFQDKMAGVALPGRFSGK